MTNRLKLKTAAPATREAMETLVGEIAELKNREKYLKAEMDDNLKTLKDQYVADFTRISDELAVKMPRALAWAETHPEDFGKGKSIEMLHGLVGWRTNTPSLKPLSRWTWELVLTALGNHRLFRYIRTKQEVNKEALLADREQLGADELRKVGVRVHQEEEFFVDPKLTDTKPRETISA